VTDTGGCGYYLGGNCFVGNRCHIELVCEMLYGKEGKCNDESHQQEVRDRRMNLIWPGGSTLVRAWEDWRLDATDRVLVILRQVL